MPDAGDGERTRITPRQPGDTLTFALHPRLDGDAGEDDRGAEPLAGRERVVVDDDGEQHREELSRQRDRAVGGQPRGQSVS